MTRSGSETSLLDPAFVARLEKLEIIARRILTGAARGEHRTARRGNGALFRDHARYSQGDDLRFLDWNVYSRLGELLIKQFESEEQLSVSLFLDASGSMGRVEGAKFIRTVEIAAALGFIALNRAASVHLGVLSQSRERSVRRTFVSRQDVDGLLRTLGEVKPEGSLDLFEATKNLVGKKRGRGVLVVLSDFFLESGYAKALHYARHAGFTVAVLHILDRADLHPVLSGRLKLVDVETHRHAVEDLAPELIEEYEAEVRTWCDGVERFCHSHDIVYSRVDVAHSLEETIRRILAEGGILR